MCEESHEEEPSEEPDPVCTCETKCAEGSVDDACAACSADLIACTGKETSESEDITVTIDTGVSVTLRDADGDGYYEISTADELYAFATAVNGDQSTIVFKRIIGDDACPGFTGDIVYGGYTSCADDAEMVYTNDAASVCATKPGHTGGTATCAVYAHCEICGASYGELSDEHNFENGSCTVCGTSCPHTFENGVGTVCGSKPATLTGVTITVDDVTYTEGIVTITPATESIIFTVTGESFAGLGENNKISYIVGWSDLVTTGYGWTIDTETNTATQDYVRCLSRFASNTTPYEVKMSNDGGSTWNNTGLYVQYDDGTGSEHSGPVITQQSTDDSAKLGETFCVTVEAEGEGLTYQWYFRKVGTTQWSKSSVTDNTYDDVMISSRHNREVYCVITDAHGNKVSTDIATITGICTQELGITQQPADAEAKLGETFCVTVEAQGDGLSYQWYFRNAGSSVWRKSGVTDNTYDDVMTEARAGREIYCVITDAWGNTVTTEIVTLICTENAQAVAMN